METERINFPPIWQRIRWVASICAVMARPWADGLLLNAASISGPNQARTECRTYFGGTAATASGPHSRLLPREDTGTSASHRGHDSD
jgi:hypothetical protein